VNPHCANRKSGSRPRFSAHDGSDLAAALQTILEIGDESALKEAIHSALGGASLLIHAEQTQFRMSLQIPGLLRPLQPGEFSDGQLRFLCLCAALLSPRPPSLLALNEPETSLHPDLIDCPGSFDRGCLKVHAALDNDAFQDLGRANRATFWSARIRLEMRDGETILGSVA